MIEAPLDKILEDDCRWEAMALLIEVDENSILASELDVMAAIRTVAVGLELPPPRGAQFKIYRKLLSEVPLAILHEATEQLIREYKFTTFPKPADWLERARDNIKLIDSARTMMRIYDSRRKAALLYYGQKQQKPPKN